MMMGCEGHTPWLGVIYGMRWILLLVPIHRETFKRFLALLRKVYSSGIFSRFIFFLFFFHYCKLPPAAEECIISNSLMETKMCFFFFSFLYRSVDLCQEISMSPQSPCLLSPSSLLGGENMSVQLPM